LTPLQSTLPTNLRRFKQKKEKKKKKKKKNGWSNHYCLLFLQFISLQNFSLNFIFVVGDRLNFLFLSNSGQQMLFFLNDFIGFVPLKIEWSDEIERCFVQIRLLLLFVFWSVSHFSLAKRLFLFCGFNLQSCQQHGRHQHFKSELSLEFSSKKKQKSKIFQS
jgi:hypothetical protein